MPIANNSHVYGDCTGVSRRRPPGERKGCAYLSNYVTQTKTEHEILQRQERRVGGMGVGCGVGNHQLGDSPWSPSRCTTSLEAVHTDHSTETILTACTGVRCSRFNWGKEGVSTRVERGGWGRESTYGRGGREADEHEDGENGEELEAHCSVASSMVCAGADVSQVRYGAVRCESNVKTPRGARGAAFMQARARVAGKRRRANGRAIIIRFGRCCTLHFFGHMQLWAGRCPLPHVLERTRDRAA